MFATSDSDVMTVEELTNFLSDFDPNAVVAIRVGPKVMPLVAAEWAGIVVLIANRYEAKPWPTP